MNKLTCHCKNVELEVKLGEGKKSLVKCNCSICKRKGATMVIVDAENVKILKGENFLKEYVFHTKVAKHYFCSNCGIYTHHYQRRDPKKCGINIGCLDNFDIIKKFEVKLIDGKNHPLDK
tara:strand:- start:229 stop:588 length:360 start_codon:yes stop_codon:yes gene_type:complete